MRFNLGQRFRQHLDTHFTQQLAPSENSRRSQYLCFSEFQQQKKNTATGQGKYPNHITKYYDAVGDDEVIHYTKDQSTLCVVCRQRIELE